MHGRCRLFNSLHLATIARSEMPSNRAVLENCSQAVAVCGCTVFKLSLCSWICKSYWRRLLAASCKQVHCYFNVMGNKANFLIGTAVVLYQIIAIWSEEGWKSSPEMILLHYQDVESELFHLEWSSLPHSWILTWHLTAILKLLWEFSIKIFSGSWNLKSACYYSDVSASEHEDLYLERAVRWLASSQDIFPSIFCSW